MTRFRARSLLRAPRAEVWAFHENPGAFERLAPPWQSLRVVSSDGPLATRRLVFRIHAGPARLTWTAQHQDCVPGERFTDRMARGPMKSWVHQHAVSDAPPTDLAPDHPACVLDDRLAVEFPLGPLGALAHGPFVRQLGRLFAFRHARTEHDAQRHAAWRTRPRLRVVVCGASGLIGSQLVPYLLNAGHAVSVLTRPGAPALWPGLPVRAHPWDPPRGVLDPAALRQADAVINLSGFNLRARWTAANRARFLDSRTGPTALLARTIAAMSDGPRVLLSASGVSGYADQRHGPLPESAPLQDTTLGRIVAAWEDAAEPARRAGIRTASIRLGAVLSAKGGALAAMAGAFRLGAALCPGDGGQVFPWLALDDALAAFEHALHDDACAGPLNAVAPTRTTMDQLTRALARVLRRPRLGRVPAAAVARLLGEQSGVVLRSCWAEPAALRSRGFAFRHTDPEATLRLELGRCAPIGGPWDPDAAEPDPRTPLPPAT